ncbi:MAG TPA: imidazole glycerol phosphate synthase subunit HisH [Puia sp.]|nr:imidazole glycerol phosphate synthase subunit HisH [Puia sp.]
MNLAIIKYNAGNIRSVLFAIERLGISATVTDDCDELRSADRVIFPGVGEASSAMAYLKARKLDQLIKDLSQPVLGICLGMQLMCKYSEENETECLGIFQEIVKKFRIDKEGDSKGDVVKVPQIGWNNISDLKSALFNGVPEDSYCYFVHGYYADFGNDTIATTDYIQSYSSALNKKNFYGVQFHPEKSAEVGNRILQNFMTV